MLLSALCNSNERVSANMVSFLAGDSGCPPASYAEYKDHVRSHAGHKGTYPDMHPLPNKNEAQFWHDNLSIHAPAQAHPLLFLHPHSGQWSMTGMLFISATLTS